MWGPYDWQIKHHNNKSKERMVMASNRSGKSRCGAAEVAIHATGLYPPWWKGIRFKKALKIMVAGPSNELTRDVCQLALLGETDRETRIPDGTGWIPRDCIGKVQARQTGVSDVADNVVVKHVSGDWSEISFMSYKMSVSVFQGVARDVVWLDEEPEGEQAMNYFTEALTRTVDTSGILIMTRTPLFGMSPIIQHFMDGDADQEASIKYTQVGWEDCPHISPKDIKTMLMSYPEHEIDCRTKGIPMMGSGLIYSTMESDLRIEPFEIPDHWGRLAGIDIGIDHPTAVAWIAIDEASGTIYLTDEYVKKGEGVIYHAAAIKGRARCKGDQVPIAWPHDARSRDKGSAEPIVQQYMDQGVKMMDISARFVDEKGGGQSTDAIIKMVQDFMKAGRLKVFSTCTEFFKEKRQYHRKDGKIVRKNDDLLSAFHYAVMMIRYSESNINRFSRGHTNRLGKPAYVEHDPFTG